jgi:solute carrier family 35 (UDP-sugar transporter), member A1/2/3
VCSCFAGVYNEFLLKGEGATVNIYVQNVFMYVDSIICNAGVLLVQGNMQAAFQPAALGAVLRPTVLLIMLNNAAIGIITSFFLKTLNSILKTFEHGARHCCGLLLCDHLFAKPSREPDPNQHVSAKSQGASAQRC